MNQEQYEEAYARGIAKAAKRMAEEIDREYLIKVTAEYNLKFSSYISNKWTSFIEPPVGMSHIAISHGGVFEELDEFKEAQVLDPKLQRTLERNYELARCKHDVKTMKRLEKQMNANYK